MEEVAEEPSPLEPQTIGPSIVALSTLGMDTIPQASVSPSDPLFTFSQAFQSKSQKEKEQIFMKAFEKQVNYIRNKELKTDMCLGKPLVPPEKIEELTTNRAKFFELTNVNTSKQMITQRTTISSSDPAPRKETAFNPTFDTLLNINFEAPVSILNQFKTVMSEILIENRAKNRAQKVLQRLFAGQSNVIENISDNVHEKNEVFPESLLSIDIKWARKRPLFSVEKEMELLNPPDIPTEPHHIEKIFQLYKPGLVERYQLTPFMRTDTSVFVPVPITPPETFPVVREEQPVREPENPLLPEDSSTDNLKPMDLISGIPPQSSVAYPRDIRFFPWDAISSLRALPEDLPELEDDIGKSSILAMPLSDYSKLSLKTKKVPIAPFKFTGTSQAKFSEMKGPDSDDLRELDADDDIDMIDIAPKPKPVSSFMTKPVSSTNKSHAIAGVVVEGQNSWKSRQKANAKELHDKLASINSLMNNQRLGLEMSDLAAFLRQ